MLKQIALSLTSRVTLAGVSDKKADWIVDKVAVEKHAGAGKLTEKYNISCNGEWLDADEPATTFTVDEDEPNNDDLFDPDSDGEVDGDGVTPVHFRRASKFSVAHARNK